MTFDETLHDTFENLGERLSAELRLAAEQLTGALQLERAREAADAAAAPSIAAPLSASAADDRLPDAVRSIGSARSLSEILDTLADCAGREAARAAVLVVRGGTFRGWRFIGFDDVIEAPGSIAIAEADAGVLAAAMRAGAPVSGQARGFAAAPSFAALPPDRESVALPIAIGGHVVAVLYADQGAAHASGETLDIGRLEVVASYAARCLEAQTAFKTARALLTRLDAPAGGAVRAHDEPADPGAAADGDAAARRYARLLVSEIKLYHEPAVVAGRRARDLAMRLGDEIARARLLFEQRVPAPQRRDYFHVELVRTLADGDASLMAVTSPS